MMRGFGGFGGFGGHLGGWGAGNGFGYGYGAFGSESFLIPFLIGGAIKVILLIVAIVIIYRLLKKRGAFTHAGIDPALDILKERYAKGEISEEEFNQRKDILTK